MHGEQAYWEEYGRTKREALRRAALLSAREKGYLTRSIHHALANEAAHDATRQRQFEKRFLSIDHPDENGNTYDYSFGNREVNRMIRALDAPYWQRVKERRWWNALYKLRHYPELQKTLRAIRTFRVRQKIISALKIKGETYEKRFQRVREILQILS